MGVLALVASAIGVAATALVPTAAQAAAPTVTCTTNPNIFNTGYNAATGGILADNAKDANWTVAGPFAPSALVAPVPAGAAFAPANLGNMAPNLWSPSPYGNAQWISQQTLASPHQGVANGDWYYRYQFNLAPAVSPSSVALALNFLADNTVAEVYVNGVAQSKQTTGLPQTTLTGPPPVGQMTGAYYYGGFLTANAAKTVLNHNWQTGLNTIDVQIKSAEGMEGFDAQIRPSELCPAPTVSLKKTATVTPTADQGAAKVGDTVAYSFTVTNTGLTALVSLAVNDPSLGTVTCPKPPVPGLAPGASVTCTSTATHTVSQADVDAGSVKNTATATGTDGAGVTSAPASADATVPTAAPAPAVSIRKSAASSRPDQLVAGEQITYSFVATNTGNVTLKDVKVNEGPFTGHGTPPVVNCPADQAASLAPGAAMTCTASYTVVQADVDAGSVKNSATGTGNPPTGPPPVSPPSEVTVPVPPAPALTVVKTSSTDRLVAGEQITYSFEVRNTGNVTLKDVKVDEGEFTGHGRLSPVTCPSGTASLAPGASAVCTATYTVTQDDVDAGSVKNTATATGTPPTGPPPVSPPSGTTVTAPSDPALTVVKTATSSRPDKLVAGEQITYSFEVRNTGNVTLKDVKVDEGPFTGHGAAPVVNCPAGQAGSLAPGAAMTCTAAYTVTQADVDAGSIRNSATATGTPPSGPPPVSPPSEVTVPTPDEPALSVTKSASTDKLVAGEQITYSFEVRNTGNVTLKDVKVNEGPFTGHGTPPVVNCPANQAGSLAPGAAMTCTAAYTVTQADVDAGSVKNSATATGTPPRGEPPVSPPSEVTITEPPAPALTAVKSATTDKALVGEEITYNFVVTNTGNVTVKDVKVDEGEFTGHGKLSPVTCPTEAGSLAPGSSVVCTATYTVVQADVDAGSIKNSATATGTPPSGPPPVSPPTGTTVDLPGEPGLSVVKSADSSRPDQLVVGEKVTYNFVVANTGNVTLKDVKVDEGEFTGHGKLSPVTCPSGAASLAPGVTVTCTATYAVTQDDVDAGSVKNSATATGTPPRGEPPVSPPSEVVVPQTAKPALAVVKSAETEKPGRLVAGETVTYRFAVTNTGNVTVKDVKVDEGEFTGHGRLSPLSCPSGAASLAPGATVTCIATYKVTQDDVDAGSIRNTATATGTPPKGDPPVSPPSEVTVPSNGHGQLGLTKSAQVVDVNHNGRTDTGDRIEWKLTVANQGTLTVTDIKVDDPTAGDVACPRTSLAPGETMECTTEPHTITTAEAEHGKVVNTATATGKAGHDKITSPEASATVKVEHTDPATPGKPAAPKPSGPGGILAYTGTAVLTVAAIGGTLLILGGIALALSRRHQRDS